MGFCGKAIGVMGALLLISLSALGQTVVGTGQLRGVVNDPVLAVVSGARVVNGTMPNE